MNRFMLRAVREEEGQDVIEYGLLGALISIVAIALMVDVGGEVNALFTDIYNALN
jgi:pilus assembly protein Flp/PilA